MVCVTRAICVQQWYRVVSGPICATKNYYVSGLNLTFVLYMHHYLRDARWIVLLVLLSMGPCPFTWYGYTSKHSTLMHTCSYCPIAQVRNSVWSGSQEPAAPQKQSRQEYFWPFMSVLFFLAKFMTVVDVFSMSGPETQVRIERGRSEACLVHEEETMGWTALQAGMRQDQRLLRKRARARPFAQLALWSGWLPRPVRHAYAIPYEWAFQLIPSLGPFRIELLVIWVHISTRNPIIVRRNADYDLDPELASLMIPHVVAHTRCVYCIDLAFKQSCTRSASLLASVITYLFTVMQLVHRTATPHSFCPGSRANRPDQIHGIVPVAGIPVAQAVHADFIYIIYN